MKQRAQILYFGENVSPLSCALLSRGVLFFEWWVPRVRMEKRHSPFWHPSFDSSCGIFGEKRLPPWLSFCTYFAFCAEGFWVRTFWKVEAPWRSFCTYCAFCAEGFWFGPFERSKPLGVHFALIVPCVPNVFWFGPFEMSKPLGIRFALIVPFVPKVFWFGPFIRSKPLGVRLDKYAKFTDYVYFANLLFLAACRCLPKLTIWAA